MKNLKFLSTWVALAFIISPGAAFSQCSFTVTTTSTNVTCYNGTTGSITVSVSGGTSPYQYQLAEAGAGAWQTSNQFTALSASTYPVSVKDASGCIKTVYVTITQPEQLAVGYTASDPSCSGSTNGSILVDPTGGTAPYTYAWKKNGTSFSTSKDITGLSSGNYLLTVTDLNGCTTAPIVTSQVKTVGLTGFNEDIVADGSNTAATSSTTRAMDQAPGNVLYATGYTNSSAASGPRGLPASGSFNSVQNSSRPYQLADYSSNNALLLRSSSDNANGGATTGTFTFLSQYKSPYSTLYVVGTTGAGTGTVNYTVNFDDGNTYTGSLNFPDWFLDPATASSIRALGSLDRVSRTSPGTFESSSNFNLYEAPISIPGGSQDKVISSISFAWSAATNARINLLAVTGYTSTSFGIRINDGATSSVSPSATVISDATSSQFCAGQSVTFTASAVNAGTTPSYQWKLNGGNVGGNSATYSNNSLANGNTVSVVVIAGGSNISCLATSTATSNVVSMSQIVKTASVSISGPSTLCVGSANSFSAVPVDGGSTPTYQWKINGGNVGSNSPTFNSNSLNNGDQLSVQMTSSIGCAANNPATGSLPLSVLPFGEPTAVITSVPSVVFSSTVQYGGTAPAFQWFKNGSPIGGANLSSYSTHTAAVGDVFSLKLTSNYACKTAPSSMSNYIAMNFITLPVRFEYFTAEKQNDRNVLLQWKTATELNNKQFIIQRSITGSNTWTAIGYVTATNQPSGSMYSYTDAPPASATYLYRLAQEDRDGHQTLSDTRSVSFASGRLWTVSDQGDSWQIQSNVPLQFKLFDTNGQLLQKGNLNGVKQLIKPTAGAIYLLQVAGANGIEVQKLLR